MSIRNNDPEGLYGSRGSDVVDADPDDTYSVIDRNSIFDGTFHTTRDLRVEGEVKGTIDCKGTLFVAEGATVGAKVEAENITVAGDLNGDIRCRGRLQIQPSGRVRGKVNTQTLVINEGAYYEGQLEMTPPDERSSSAPPRAVGGPPVAIGSAGTRQPNAEGGNTSTFIRRLGGPETPWSEPTGTEGEKPEGAE